MHLLRPSNFKRKIFFVLSDILIIIFSTLLAFELRFDFHIEEVYIKGLLSSILFLIIIRLILFVFLNIYNISWRHFGINDLVKLLFGLIISSIIFIIVIYGIRSFNIIIPRSIIPIEFFISLFFIFSLRISKRVYLEMILKTGAYVPTIVVASTDKAVSIIKSLHVNKQKYLPVSIIDDRYTGMKVNNIIVNSYEYLRNTDDKFEAAIVDKDIDIQSIYPMLQKCGITDIKVSESYSDMKTSLKDISVEDLLARHPKDLDKEKIENFIKDKIVLITGAGGSIGSEISRQCKKFGAKKLILLDHSEYNLYQIIEEVGDESVVPVMQTVRNFGFIENTFEKYKPEIVIHAAAYKHVPLVEDNILEGISNNIIGTKNCIDLSIKYNVEKFVLISTDKAVRPTNVMGTTKRICELYAQNVDSKSTEIVAVRFGNVLGSSGSVIPKFKAQIEAGGPITVTHPDITRYFMLIPEACELVLQAASIGKGGEIFILDMGEPIKIVDLAKKMIELSGRDEIEIEYCGLRPGEKLFEELLMDDADRKTEYDSITVACPTKVDINLLNKKIDELLTNDDRINILKEIVPEFNHKLN